MIKIFLLQTRIARIALIFAIVIPIINCKAKESQWFYKERDNNRKEGIIERPVSARELEVVSFTGLKEDYDLDSSVVMRIKYFSPKSDTVNIKADELVPIFNYQMDAFPQSCDYGWNEFLYWPSATILDTLKLTIADLGILANYRTDFDLLIPAFIYHSILKNRHEIYYNLQVKSIYDLEMISYAVKRKDEKEELIEEILEMHFSSNSPIAFSIDFIDLKEGYYDIEIESRIKGEFGGPSLQFTFYHKLIIE
ncbi:MAG: hypothetical protein JXI43_09230 [Tissierellales bacterium]|nr:hypothetical protein [Tissierellales bacterium]